MVRIQVKTPRSLRRAKRRIFFESLLGGQCVNCMTTRDLQFDHVIPEDKKFNLGTSCMEFALETILPELQKCQLLCKTCHLDKTISDAVGYRKHGSAGTYVNHKCRCEDCKSAWYIYTRRYVYKYNSTDVETRKEQQKLRYKRYYAKKIKKLQA